ncbi:caspase recruitment domain-containing protein 6 [Echinops telfairi]|uniref:Caspase recruitment domain-containing protein 6 n=1 Tax=Echinops telfairi TaxID=9371 RepID=A0AC55CLE6_ECHTE|nr:caspase recruitment domain-containing protein 6 [Echinops telfairi]
MAVPSEIIEKERKKLLEILQQDPDSVLDTLTSRRLLSETEYDILEGLTDPLKKSRKLLIWVQQKGEVSCLHFLQCLVSTFPESAASLRHGFLQCETVELPQSTRISKNSEDAFFHRGKQPGNPQIAVSFKEKGQLDLEASESFGDKSISDGEMALPPKEKNEKKRDIPNDSSSYLREDIEYEIPSTIAYLRNEQRYEIPDDSLYLGQEDYRRTFGCPEDVDPIVEEENDDASEHMGSEGEENSEYSAPTDFSDDEQSHEEAEAAMLLEEEQERERKKVFTDVLSCLNLDRSRKLLPEFVEQFSLDRSSKWTPETPGDLAWNFLMKVQALDVTARDAILGHRVLNEGSKGQLVTEMENLELGDIQTINPLDVLCATMLCSESPLQLEVMANMCRCQFALPLLLPDAENNRSILMLGAMKDIVMRLPAPSSGGLAEDTESGLTCIKMPVVSFVRLQSCSFSKSRILNALLSPAQRKPHQIFLHRDSPGLVLPRQISDGLVELTWPFPDEDGLKGSHRFFQKPVAVANLRGDLERCWIQFSFLMEVSSAVFFCTDYLGEKEWSLLRYLGKAAMERCYFVLSSQARESEEALVFQRILELKPSQLLFLEGEEAGDGGQAVKCLHTALQEVMGSPLRCVSVEDMAFLARELGIQVDKDCQNPQGLDVPPSENRTGTAEPEGQQGHAPPQIPPQGPTRQPGVLCGLSQNSQDIYSTPVFMPPPHISSPFPSRSGGGNFNQASLRPPWFMGSRFWSGQRCKWFRPTGFRNIRAHRSFGVQCFQPPRFYSGDRFMNRSPTAQACHWNGMPGRPPRPIFQHTRAQPARTETMGALGKAGAVVSQVDHFHCSGSQPARGVGRPTCAQGAQLAAATGQHMQTLSCIKDPHQQTSQAAGTVQKPRRPASQPGAQQKTQTRLSNPAVQTQPHPMLNSKPSPSFQPQSHQPKHSQAKPSQTVYCQSRPAQPQPSQTKSSMSKPSQPTRPQSKSYQPRPSQPKSAQTKACYSRVGSRR